MISVQGILLLLIAIAGAALVLVLAGFVFVAVLRAIGVVCRLVGAVIAIALGGAFDLVAATLSLLPIAWNAGAAIALLLIGRWSPAERRAAAINASLVGIARRLRNAVWDRPTRLLAASSSQRPAAPRAMPVPPSSKAPPPPPAWMSPRHAAAAAPAAAEERSLGSAVHLLALCGLMVPSANILAPLFFWIAKRESSRFLDDQGREAINFNITMALAALVGLLLTPLLVGLLILPLVFLLWLVLTIVAGVKANAGEWFRYPFCIPFLSRPAGSRSAAAAVRADPGDPAAFPGYEVVGTLPAGGSGAKLFIASPRAGSKVRLPAGFDRVVIKSFILSQGSTLPQIVRESRAMEAATRLGLVLEHHLDGLDGQRFWYAMPYYPGPHFGEAVHRLHRFGPREGLDAGGVGTILAWLSDLAATLDRYHAAGLWHKDVKPDNVIVGEERAQLVDVGLVSSLASAMTLTTHGTEYFRDPEMVRMALRGVKVHEVDGVRFDLYGLGAMLYLALEDTFPAHGGLSAFSKRSPEALRWVVRRAMAEYSKRYESAAAMRRDLEFIRQAKDPFAVLPASLPSMRGAAAEADPPPADGSVEPDAARPSPQAWDRRGGALVERIEREIAGFESAMDSAVGSAIDGPRRSPSRRTPRWGLTSAGGTRGAGRTLASLTLFAIGVIVALVATSIFFGRESRPPAPVVVIGPEGDLSGIAADSLLMASVREHFARDRRVPEVQFVAANAAVAGDVARLAEPLRERTRDRIVDRLDDAGIRGAVLIDPARGVAIVAAAAPIARTTLLWGAIDLGEWGSSWTVEQVPLERILPAAPGQRLLLLRDPAATAVIAPGEVELWRALGVEVVEPDAETAAELALLLARPLGPEGRARIDAILEAQRCDDLRQVREALPARRGVGEPSAAAIDAIGPPERGVVPDGSRYAIAAHAAWAAAAVD